MLIKEIIVIPVKLYQKWISPLKIMPCCRFYPTCSQYAIDSIVKYGVFLGVLKSVKRILKCNPFHPGGYDPA